MLAITGIGVFFNFVLMGMFWHKRNTPVIRAASKVFSFLILIGEPRVWPTAADSLWKET